MLDLARHIVNQKAGHFEPDKFEDQYETAFSISSTRSAPANPSPRKRVPAVRTWST